jgi:hypothetical protein
MPKTAAVNVTNCIFIMFFYLVSPNNFRHTLGSVVPSGHRVFAPNK